CSRSWAPCRPRRGKSCAGDGRAGGQGWSQSRPWSALLGSAWRAQLSVALARWPCPPWTIPIAAALALAPATAPSAALPPEAATLSAEAAAFAAEAAALAIAPIVAIALAHLHGGLGLVPLDTDGQKANDIGRQAHAALHLGNHSRGRFDVHERIVRL